MAINPSFKALALLSCLCASLAGVLAATNQSPFATQPWNIKGQLLVLDVGSLQFQGNHPIAPLYSQEGCADTCMRTPGCNAWTYCSKKEGCGSGCQDYIAKNPQLKYASAPNGNPTIPNPDWFSQSSISGFGPWGLTGNCKFECDGKGSCKPGDKFPYGMCSLKQLGDTVKPQYWSTNAAEGWISGVWTAPQECLGKGISGRACTRCRDSKDPINCLKCAATPAFQLKMLQAALNASLQLADGCAACYNAQQPSRCVDCLTGGSTCAACALQQLGPKQTMDVDACIGCTSNLGPKFKDACVGCAALGGQPVQLRNCLTCLDAMKPLVCNNADYQAPCWNPIQRTSSCSTCATSAADFATCLQCMKSKPFSDNCGGCATLPASQQAQCYKCSKEAAHPGSGCSDCLRYVTDATQQKQCVSCLTDPKTTSEGKNWCFGCQNWCNDFAGRAKCNACLATKQDAYMTACSCSH